MRLLTLAVFVCWAVLLVSGDGQGAPKVEPEPQTTTVPTTTTTAATTTPPPKTTSTTTTTKPPTTSTVAPNTTTTTTTTTTATPPTTSTAAPTTTAAPPTPVPDPKPGKWVVNSTNETCIILRMAVQLNVTYVTVDNKTAYGLITLPSDSNATIATGICGATEQVIYIKWRSAGATANNSLVFHFVKNETKYYSLHHIEAYVVPQALPRVNTNATLMMIHNTSEYKTALSNSYRCMRAQDFKMSANATATAGLIKVSDLQFQAFRKDKSNSFGYAEDCAFDTQDVVPIAVGCALIALVIIVLVAYLAARRRSQARGYVSM